MSEIISLQEQIEFVEEVNKRFNEKWESANINKVRAILASLKELEQKQGKCRCNDSTGDITVTVCNCCGKPIKSEPWQGKIEWGEEK